MDRFGPDTTVFVVFMSMATAALMGVLVLVVIGVRRKEAKPVVAVLAFAGVIAFGLFFLAAAAEQGALNPWLARYPHHARAAILASISAAARWFWFAAACGAAIVALARIVAAFAMLPGLAPGPAQRLAMLFPVGYRNLAERWGELTYGVRVWAWVGHVLIDLVFLYLAAVVLLGGVLRGAWTPRFTFWAFTAIYCLATLANLRLRHYDRLAGRLERDASQDGAGQAASG